MSDCPFCGEDHDPGPVGEPGGPFAGIPILTCPKLPPEHIYVDDRFLVGPRGRLFSVGDLLRRAGEKS